MKGVLYIVSTPIGNIEDITLRALRVLKEVDIIAAEDTRHTRRLLTHYGISKPLISCWSAKEKVKTEEVISKLKMGKDVALVTDAGTPGISDPGGVVVKRAVEEGLDIVPIPGPSALMTALSVSEIFTREFLYIGFLPSRRNQRIKKLEEIKLEKKTLLLFESPHRLLDSLSDMYSLLGDRSCNLCHELTKFHEEVLRGKLSHIIDALKERTIAGEYVIITEGSSGKEISMEDAVKEVIGLMKKGLRRKEVVKKIAHQYGISQKRLYEESLKDNREA